MEPTSPEGTTSRKRKTSPSKETSPSALKRSKGGENDTEHPSSSSSSTKADATMTKQQQQHFYAGLVQRQKSKFDLLFNNMRNSGGFNNNTGRGRGRGRGRGHTAATAATTTAETTNQGSNFVVKRVLGRKLRAGDLPKDDPTSYDYKVECYLSYESLSNVTGDIHRNITNGTIKFTAADVDGYEQVI